MITQRHTVHGAVQQPGVVQDRSGCLRAGQVVEIEDETGGEGSGLWYKARIKVAREHECTLLPELYQDSECHERKISGQLRVLMTVFDLLASPGRGP